MRYLLLLAPLTLLAGPARYARIGDMAGSVEAQISASDPWTAAERNAPLPESARIRTGAASRVEIELDEGSALRLGPNTQAEISDYARLSTGQRVTLLSIDHGVAYLSGAPEGRDALSLVVPGAQVTLTRSAHTRVEVEPQWSQIAILSGFARFSSPAAELELRAGQTTRVEPANPARFFFYKEVLPADLDEWSRERIQALRSPSGAHVIQRYGLADLDGAGEWILTADLGALWHPKVDDDWRPYRDGRWRWYDGLGYTWIAAERWGWLPYHYGRWTRLEKLGWVWTPSKNGVFKPGDVYWLRGDGYVGWGPLGPGEEWSPADPVNAIPQQFLKAYTTYASYAGLPSAIDPAGFNAAPDDPLKDVDFLSALPSPPFSVSKLDSLRPLVNATSLRVKPLVEGVAIETVPREQPEPRPAPAPAPAPVVVVTRTAPPPPEVVEVPVPVPAGVVYVATSPRHDDRRHKRYRNASEAALASRIVQELDARAYQKALADLDQWTQRWGDSDFSDERAYYYMLAFHGLNQPGKVVDRGAALVARAVTELFDDPMQALSVVYLIATDYATLPGAARNQTLAARNAARQMLAMLPVCFTSDHRPPTISAADWAKSRADLEALARQTLARANS